MDIIFQKVEQLYMQGMSQRQIALRTEISMQKVRKILITLGRYSSPNSEIIQTLYARGLSKADIAKKLKITENAVSSYLPYERGQLPSENPSKNALAIRRCRSKQ